MIASTRDSTHRPVTMAMALANGIDTHSQDERQRSRTRSRAVTMAITDIGAATPMGTSVAMD